MLLDLEFEGEAFEWRGPAPYLFVRVSEDVADEIREIARQVSYGWGVIPAQVSVGNSTVTTSLFPREGGYLVPIKVALQRSEGIEVGTLVRLRLQIG